MQQGLPLEIQRQPQPNTENQKKVNINTNKNTYKEINISPTVKKNKPIPKVNKKPAPKVNPNVLTVNRAAFLNSVKRVSYFSNKTTHQVRLGVETGALCPSLFKFAQN